MIRFLVKHKMVDCLVTTAGGIEEDFIKCLAPTYVDEFHYKGAEARKRGLNRIGNLIAPNNGYCKFEEWLRPIMDKMLEEQNSSVRLYNIILIDKRIQTKEPMNPNFSKVTGFSGLSSS